MPHDLGFTIPRERKAVSFLGDRGLHTPAANAPDRQQLIGIAVPEGADVIPTGAHIVERTGGASRSIGFVTSSYLSPTLNRPIALALMRGGMARIGEPVTIWHNGKIRNAMVCSPTAFDAEGDRLHA